MIGVSSTLCCISAPHKVKIVQLCWMHASLYGSQKWRFLAHGDVFRFGGKWHTEIWLPTFSIFTKYGNYFLTTQVFKLVFKITKKIYGNKIMSKWVFVVGRIVAPHFWNLLIYYFTQQKGFCRWGWGDNTGVSE